MRSIYNITGPAWGPKTFLNDALLEPIRGEK
jgi:hypothetical protein